MFRSFATIMLIVVIAVPVAAQSDTVMSTQVELDAHCTNSWSERFDPEEITTNVVFSGEPIQLTTPDGEQWGSDHDVATITFEAGTYVLDLEQVRTEPFREGVNEDGFKGVLADYIGSVEMYMERHGGSPLAALDDEGVVLGWSFVLDGDIYCYGHRVIRF